MPEREREMAAVNNSTWLLIATFCIYMFILVCMVLMSDAVRTYAMVVKGWAAWFQVLWFVCFAMLIVLSLQCAANSNTCPLVIRIVTTVVILQVLINVIAMFVVHIRYNAKLIPSRNPPASLKDDDE